MFLEQQISISLGGVYTTPFSTENGKRFMNFGHSFTQQWHFGGLKMQTFENGLQKVLIFENDTVIIYM